MGFAVNLLHEPSPERAAIEVTLDLDPAEFTRAQVRDLKQGTADFLKIDQREIRVLSVARWKPIIGLGLPTDGAERMVWGFEHGAIAWRRAMRPLEIASVCLDPSTKPIRGSDKPVETETDETSGGKPWIRQAMLAALAMVVLIGIAGAILSALFSALSGLVTWIASAGDDGAAEQVAQEAPAVKPPPPAGDSQNEEAPSVKAPPPATDPPNESESQRLLLPLRPPESVRSLRFEKGDRHVVVTTDQGSLYFVALGGNQAEKRRLRIPTAGEGFDHAQTTQLAHHADGEKSASVRHDGSVRIHYPGNLPTELRSPYARLARVEWSPDGDRLIAFTTDGRIEIWSTFVRDGRFAVWNGDGKLFAYTTTPTDGGPELTEVWQADGPRHLLSLPGRRARFSRYSSRLVTVAQEGFQIWDADGKALATFSVGASDHRQASAIEISPNGKWLAALFRHSATLWVLRTETGHGRPLRLERENGSSTPTELVWSGDSQRLGAIWRNDAWLWDVGKWDLPRVLPNVEDLTWTADGSRLLTRSKDGVRVWLGDGQGMGVQLFDRALSSAAWNADGRWLAVVHPSAQDNVAQPIELLPINGLQPAAARARRELPWSEFGGLQQRSAGAPMRVAFNADGTRLMSVGWARPENRLSAEIKVWRLDTSTPSAVTLPRYTRSLRNFSISADGRWVLTEDDNRGTRSVRLWQADGPSVLGGAESRDLVAASWSPNSRLVAAISSQGVVRVWRPQSAAVPTAFWQGQSLRRPPTRGSFRPPVWGPEGRRLLTFAADGTIVANPIARGVERLIFTGHSEPVTDAAWSPDGRFLLSTSLDGWTRIWSAENAGVVAKVEERRGALVAGAWSSDGLRLATVDVHGILKVWPVPDRAR